MHIKHLLVLCLFTTLLFSRVYAQQLAAPINSAKEIQRGIEFAEKGDFAAAITAFQQVSENDTNYIIALNKLAKAQYLADEYRAAIATAETGLQTTAPETATFHLILGQAYGALEQYDTAVIHFQEGLKHFPKNDVLYFEMGLVQEFAGDYTTAYQSYQAALQLDPSAIEVHLGLSRMCGKAGYLSEAMLAFNTAILLAPLSEEVTDALEGYDQLLSTPHLRSIKFELPDQSTSLEQMNAAFQSEAFSNYKSKSKLKTNRARYNNFLLEKLDSNSQPAGFWDTFYLPFFQAMQQTSKAQGLVNLLHVHNPAPKIQKELKKRFRTIEEVLSWSTPFWNDLHLIREVKLEDESQALMHWHNSQGDLFAIGNADTISEIRTGPWQFYFQNGRLSSNGQFNADGERDGEWRSFYPGGQLKEIKQYDNGDLDGQISSFNKQGVLIREGEYVEGKLQGLVKEYFETGGLSNVIDYEEGEPSGVATFYYRNGNREYEIPYRDGLIEDTVKQYHSNGQLMLQVGFKEGNKEGKMSNYYDDGQLESISHYTANKSNGEYLYYHRNGQLAESGSTKDDLPFGAWTSFYPSGQKKSEANYDANGRLTGAFIEFNRDGQMIYNLVYERDVLNSYTYFDSTGAIQYEGQSSGKELDYKDFHLNGSAKTEGKMLNGKRHGLWKDYDQNGQLKATSEYKKEQLHGMRKEYYPNGAISSTSKFKKGKREGPMITYYRDGTKASEAYYQKGVSNGTRYEYYHDGTLAAHSFLLEDKKHGIQRYFHPNGQLKHTSTYVRGHLVESEFFDTAGSVRELVALPNATGEAIFHHINGGIRSAGYYKDGSANGTFTWYYSGVKPESEGKYNNNQRQGIWTWYYESGSKEIEGYFASDLEDSTWTHYHENGAVKLISHFEHGQKSGTWKYFYESGKLEAERTYLEGKLNGAANYYSEDGFLQLVRYYDLGRLVGYSYEGTDGELVSPIALTAENGNVSAFYKNGNPSISFTKTRGWLEGDYNTFFSNGKLRDVSRFLNDERSGPQLTYYANGQLKSEVAFAFDELNGTSKFYTKTGELMKSLEYHAGNFHGTCKYYENGKLTKVRKYHYGTLLEEEVF